MGHALGFNSLVGDREQTPTNPLALTVWDIFRFRPGTANLNNFSTVQRILSSGGLQVHFAGGPELGLSTGRPSEPVGGDGNQGSHWKADEQSGTFIGVMDPTIRTGQRYTMTDNDRGAIDAFGFTISATTAPPTTTSPMRKSLAGAQEPLTAAMPSRPKNRANQPIQIRWCPLVPSLSGSTGQQREQAKQHSIPMEATSIQFWPPTPAQPSTR